MSYLVLARKYRPRNFTEMVGQEHVVQALTNALIQQRLHHAYLFTGTRGVGKTTVSRILAKSLNCQGLDGQGGITAEPCGVCQACQDIDSGRFVDYTELDAASNRGVDEVQSLLEQAVYKPVQGRFKVFMIDEVHMLTNTAFNAMLKTLEEPPEYLKFVLATTDPQKVPVTVLSRCLQFNLRPMAPETVYEHLTKVLVQESLPAEPMALKLLARAARGSMRDALSLTDQAIAFGSGQLQEATVRLMLGSVDQSHVLGLIDALARADGAEVVRISETLRVNGLSAASALEDMSVALQRMAVLQAVPQAAAESDDPDHLEMLRLSQAMPADETQLLYSLCLHGRGELGLAPDEYAAFTMVLLRLLAFKPKQASVASAASVASVASGTAPMAQKKTLTTTQTPPLENTSPIDEPQTLTPANLAPTLAPEPEEPRVTAPRQVQTLQVRQASEPTERTTPRALVATEEGDFWVQTVRNLISSEAINALVREFALQSQLIARDTDQWHLRIESESLNQGVARERLQTALHDAGHPVKLVVEIGKVSDSPAQRNAVALAEKQKAAEDLIHSDPLVQAMVQDFGAKIVPGSIKLIS
ncbi:MAG: DNA polymerase III subunit gamma/tau [Limnohabitans sp.]|jgi:DNA polymerase-3 subunit gamma/tau